MKVLILLLLILCCLQALRVDLAESDQHEHRLQEVRDAILHNKYRPVTQEERVLMSQGKFKLNKAEREQSDSNNAIVDLTNFKDFQYYGPVQVGNPSQKFTVIYDTGSSWFWVPKTNCVGCPDTKNRFDPTASSTYESSGVRNILNYGKGSAGGYISSDLIGLKGTSPGPMTFIPVDQGSDLIGQQADGIAGLAPTSNDGADLLVDSLYDTDVIDKKEFTVFIGKKGQDNSFIDFGSNQDNQENVTFLELKPVRQTDPLIYWSVDLDEFKYGNNTVELSTTSTVWDTGTSLIGFTESNLDRLAIAIAGDRDLFVVKNSYYAVSCSGVDDFKDLEFTFKDKTVTVSRHEYVNYSGGLCSLMFVVLSDDVPQMQFTLLGDSFLRGNKAIHDMENQRIGLFLQKYYDYSNNIFRNLIWLWILLGCVGVLIIGISSFCIWKHSISKKSSSGMKGRYVKVGGHSELIDP